MISNFDKYPKVTVKGRDDDFFAGWESIINRLMIDISMIPGRRKIVVVECYQGVDDEEVFGALSGGLRPDMMLPSSQAFLPETRIREMTQPDVTDDRIFGYMTRLEMLNFLDPEKIETMQAEISQVEEGIVLLYGPGSSIILPAPDLMIYADMARWEIQLRMRRNEVSNLGITNSGEHIEGKYKRGYFVDWRVCDRLKRKVLPCSDWILDTNRKNQPAMISDEAFADAMKMAVSRPFSVVPYFDAGPWGGQWMKETFDLPGESANYAWCFNCVPEENSLYLEFEKQTPDPLAMTDHGKNRSEIPPPNTFNVNRFETPAINLVFFRSEELLGSYVRESFGDEFPIRFDFLDTMRGGNLSLQVHPLTGYIKEQFGIHYTQDESYYLVEAGNGARVYLGLKEGIDPEAMIRDLKIAESNDIPFDDALHVQAWPARKHDHFLIPGGTVHCSGKDCMVLEISATPYIFTFKLWDWGRLGMDGKPRPINIEHGARNIRWYRTEHWTRQNLVNRIEPISEGDGWIEEKTGLHELEFIETRRHRFTKKVIHNTQQGVNVICLVEGREVVVESPAGSFDPFAVHYAETFIVPAAVGEYSIRPYGESEGKECITIKAYIRNV